MILVASGSGVFVGGVAEDELALLSQEIESSGGEYLELVKFSIAWFLRPELIDFWVNCWVWKLMRRGSVTKRKAKTT